MKLLHHHLLWPVILAKSGVFVSAVNVDISSASGGQVDVNYINDLGLEYPTVPRDVEPNEDYPNFGLLPETFVDELLIEVPPHQEVIPMDGPGPEDYSMSMHDVNETYSMPMIENYLYSQIGTDGDGSNSSSAILNLRNQRHLLQESRQRRKHHSKLHGSAIDPPEDTLESDGEMVANTDEASSFASPRHTSGYGYFYPLECNANLDDQVCTNLSDNLPSGNNPLVVPCGVCYKYDLKNDVSFPGGIHIMGKLHFKTSSKGTITTPYVIVEGVLTLRANTISIGPSNEKINFVLTGTDSVQFEPTEAPNTQSCPLQGGKNICDLGPKPFVVAGGKLDIQAFDDTDCSTHTPILDKVYRDIAPDETKFPKFRSFPSTCRTNSSPTDFFSFDFDSGFGNWTGNYGAFLNTVDNAFQVTHRGMSENGPQYDFTSLFPADCLVPDQKYLVSMRIKLDREDGTLHGQPTTCKNSSGHGDFCPHIYVYIRKKDQSTVNQFVNRMYSWRAPNYGEWYDFTASLKLTEEQLDPTNIFSLIRVYHADPGVDMTLDHFRISLPSEAMYHDPNEFCSELILNGDAEGDEMHPYPISASHHLETVFVLSDDDGNRFFRLPDRHSSSSTLQSWLNIECLEKGVTYLASAKMRIHSEFEEEFYFYLRYKLPDNSWHHQTYLDCPGQRYADGWVVCSGEFTVGEHLASAVEVVWRFHFHNARDITVTVDFDDMSIKYHRGIVDKLVVDKADAKCWEPGAEVHVGSSSYYSWQWLVPNSFTTVVSDVTDNGDNTLSIGLTDAPYIPILTLAEDKDFATDVALLTRNIKITNSDDEDSKGAYLQILKTPNVTQTINGVEFINMGRRGEPDRHPITLTYSDTIEGSVISSNSIHGSNSRCIDVEGTSNATISGNVASRNIGHCVYIGWESRHNLFENNFVSDTIRAHAHYRLPFEFDDFPAAYRNRYGWNDFVSNKAIGNAYYGFSFDNNYWTVYEDHSQWFPLTRGFPMGTFALNEAKSNGDSGIHLYHMEQTGHIRASGLKIVKNRYYGLYMYNGARFSLEDSLLAENAYNLELRWCDNINVTNVDIRGISPSTMHLTNPPYYNKPCLSSGFYSPIGYRMHTSIYRWGGLRKGVKLENVNFTLFDHKGQCSSSVAVDFSTEMRDGHWDYTSSFINVRMSGNKLIDAKSANEFGISDVIISDPDGASNPSLQSSGLSRETSVAGSFVSNKRFLTEMARGECNLYYDGIAYCEDACYRTVQLMINQEDSLYYDIEVVRDDGTVTYPSPFYDYDDDYNRSLYEDYSRKFPVYMTHGHYTIRFLENGKPVWPRYVYEKWEGVPECDGHVSTSNMTIFEPELLDGECDDLIQNGDMEQGLKGWMHREPNSGNPAHSYLKSLPGAGVGGSKAVGIFDRRSQYEAVGQNFDPRCLRENHGAIYEIKAHFRLEQDGNTFICDRFSGGYPTRCPKGTLKHVRYTDPATKEDLTWDYNQDLGMVVMPNDSSDFNLIHGVLKIDDTIQSLKKAWFYFEHFDASLDMIIDNYSITKMEHACNGDLVRNGDFAVGDSRFYLNYGTVRYDVIDFPGASENKAMKIHSRSHESHGVYQNLYIDTDCLNEFDRIRIFVRYQIQDSNGRTKQCDRSTIKCLYMRSKTYSEFSDPHPWVASPVVFSEDEDDPDWAWLTGIYKIGNPEANHSRMYIHVGGPQKEYDIILDKIEFELLPMQCNQLFLNPSFDGSTAYWNDNSAGAAYSIYKNGSDDAVLFQHTAHWEIIQQAVDSRCAVEGQTFILKANFKLLDVSDLSQSLSCRTDERNVWNVEHCPTIRFRGGGCDADFHTILFNQKEIVWDPDAMNAFEYEIPIDANMASCTYLNFEFGWFLPVTQALVIDDVALEQQTTFAPTAPPTLHPTIAKTIGPTPRPTVVTDSPTTSLVVSCPPVGQTIELAPGSVILSIANADSLCTVVKAFLKTDTIIPLVRSYDLNKWEAAPGDVAASHFDNDLILCYDEGCQINLPQLESGEVYLLSSKTHSISNRDEFARFLETATFGATSSDLDTMEAAIGEEGPIGVIVDYIESQMDETIVPASSHREFWRQRANPRSPWTTTIGTPSHPCQGMSRWRKFSFVRNDALWWAPRILNVRRVKPNRGGYRLYLEGQIRTVVNDFWLAKNDTYRFDPDFDYYLCSVQSERSDGNIWIRLEDGKCVQAENPPVDLRGKESESQYILDLSSVEDQLTPIDTYLTNGEEFLLPTSLEGAVCDSIPSVPDPFDEHVFGKLSDGTFLIFDPRLDLQENTPDSPVIDGGKAKQLDSGGRTYCSNVPRTFLNEDQCVLSSDACRPSADTQVEVLLEDDTLKLLHNLTGRYVYAMEGFNVVDQIDEGEDFAWKLPHPCTDNLRSRWMKKDLAECVPTDMYSGTNETLFTLLSAETDRNPYIRDIHFSIIRGHFCNATDISTTPEVEIEVGNVCWKRVHDDYLSIYDLTYWVDRHPGGAGHITKWAENDEILFEFPNRLGMNAHPMYRWHDNVHKFTYVGRYGDTTRVRDLPNDLRTEAVTDYYQDAANVDTSGVLVCGSPGEIANDKTQDFTFDAVNDFLTAYWYPDENKSNIWAMLNLNAPDQLRQRVAWALAQILVVVKSAIGDGGGYSEWFLQYYDILVRNAFGNYRDILREISYSPLMAENLSFLYSRSSAYVWQQYGQRAQADENFAREIMQLFSIGLEQLNLDGSPKLDENGNTILAYTNDDIMSLSRAWTGFRLQPRRGNMEGRDNRLDPMRLESSWRDRFPKTDTTGGYIGDYYPLCEDLPDKAFLEQGATYRFLGSSSLPQLMTDPIQFESEDDIIHFVLDSSSPLRAELCNPDDSNVCQFSNTVVLSNSKTCFGVECEVHDVRVVQVAPNAFYEYVRMPCVAQSFFNNAKKISPYYSHDRRGVMCGNPSLPEASEACCSFGSTTASRNSNYDGERMPFGTASDRCTDVSKKICDFSRVDGVYHKIGYSYFWTSDECLIRVKVKGNGMVTIVHQTYDTISSDTAVQVPHMRDENENWFKVYWDNDNYPTASNECDGLCQVVEGDSCLCGTSVSKSRGFGGPPGSVDEILERLFIGFPNPNIVNSESYSSTFDPKTGVTIHLKDGVYDTYTVFEFSDEKGRQFFVKNSVETVQVRTLENSYTGLSFRNAPQFMSFVPTESTVRDAQFETEATLDHYFYHDNTAPFLASRWIQRLVISNPSPRYVKAVSIAFLNGVYEKEGKSFGTGKYGDLSATFAAIYLDREARSVTLDIEPSYGALREPLLKVMSVLRSMDFTMNRPITRLRSTKVAIGQFVHEFDSVFSFFLPEFQPYGRVGDASLVSPEATLLDMPRIVGFLNGITSLTRYGLSSCFGGFGAETCRERLYFKSRVGILEHNVTASDSEFFFETFEGPSLVGGFDNNWSGRVYYSYRGEVTSDPLGDSSNHVYRALFNWHGHFFSQPVSNAENIVVKFRYLGSEAAAGGCIGYSSVENLQWENWVFCHANIHYAPNVMESNNEWISCQYEIPLETTQFRIVLGKRRDNGESYFDDIQIGPGSGTFCDSSVDIEDIPPPGKVGYSAAVVDELATLLTSGRLSGKTRQIITDAYDRAGSANDGLRIAQEMILTSSEFHSTNPVGHLDEPRTFQSFPPPTGKPYKALIYLMLNGGCDSYNMLTPHTCSKSNDVYESYLKIRDLVAISKNDLLPIDAENQNCTKYGIHPELPAIQQLYNDGDLMFFANTGVMTQPVNKFNYWVLTNTQLFAHNHQQRETKRVDPYDSDQGTGVIGRMADILNGLDHNVGSFSVDRFSVALVGTPGVSLTPMIVNRDGVPKVYLGDELAETLPLLHNSSSPDSGFFGETWSNELMSSLETNNLLGAELENVTTTTTFPTSYLSIQLQTVARLIATREARGVDTDTFYIETFGFDTHSSVEQNLRSRFIEINGAVEAFASEMKHMNMWNNVTLIQTSDFARTLSPNSGLGTDHAWGGNYMMMGGSVKGKQIVGEYPDTFDVDGPLNIGRGRLIPSTPWDAVFASIGAWMGVPHYAMGDVCPNMGNFDSSYFFDPNDLFEGVPPPPPTASPTDPPPTTRPTDTPSIITSAPTTASPTAIGSSNSPSNSPTRITSQPSISPSKTPTVPPTQYPTYDANCEDEPGYKFKGKKSTTCSWAGKSLNRCAGQDNDGSYMLEHCRATCGQCQCQNDAFRYRGNTRWNCAWVNQRKSRCNMHPTIRANCKGVCDEKCCKDDPTYLFKNRGGRNCAWVKKNTARRCRLMPNAQYCPEACGLCP